MPIPFDPSTDFIHSADGLETATLRRRSTPGALGTVITHALRRSVTTREAAASGGRYTASDVTWHLPVAELAEAPRLGDVLCDAAGRHWTVLDVAQTTLGSRWQCTSRSLAVVYGLDDTITILQATYLKSSDGAMEPTWRPWKTGVRARIQPVSTRTDPRQQSRQTSSRHQIFVEESLSLNHTHRILGPEGTVYKVLGATAAQRIGELQTIDAEVTPWP